VERLLLEDSREKKRAGTGVFKRASRTGRIGNRALRTESYFLTPTERKKLNGELNNYNMYDLENIKALDELMEMPKEQARDYVIKLREKHKVKELVKAWEISNAKIYSDVFKPLDVPVKNDSHKKVKEQKQKEKTTNKETGLIGNGQAASQQVAATIETERLVDTNVYMPIKQPTFQIGLNGEFMGEEIGERLLGFGGILDKHKKYKVYITIVEE
jgi:hypothetical protein